MAPLPWAACPPRNFFEEFAHGRKNQALQVATNVLTSLFMARSKHADTAYEQPNEDDLVRVWNDTCVNVRVFTDGPDELAAERQTSVCQTDETARVPGGWFWPPRS